MRRQLLGDLRRGLPLRGPLLGELLGPPRRLLPRLGLGLLKSPPLLFRDGAEPPLLFFADGLGLFHQRLFFFGPLEGLGLRAGHGPAGPGRARRGGGLGREARLRRRLGVGAPGRRQPPLQRLEVGGPLFCRGSPQAGGEQGGEG